MLTVQVPSLTCQITKQQTDNADEVVFEKTIEFKELNKKVRRNDRHKFSSIIQENDIGRFADGQQEPYVEIVETNFDH